MNFSLFESRSAPSPPVVINGSGHVVVANSFRDLFLDILENRDASNCGGKGVGD